jgi:hypothetical protein
MLLDSGTVKSPQTPTFKKEIDMPYPQPPADPYDANAYLQHQIDVNTWMFHGDKSQAPAQYGSGPGQTPYFTPGAFKAFRAGIWALIFAPVMMRIGRNWYAQTSDLKHAMGRCIIVSAMWKVWGTAVVWWFYINSVLSRPDVSWWTRYSDGTPNNPTVILVCRLMQWVVLFGLLLAYCKLVDMSLFKHRFVYRMFQPIRKYLDWIPWVVLISLVMMPVFFYIQMAVVRYTP